MELFDILDKDGKPTGLTAAKGTQLQGGHFYLGIHVYIYNSSMEFLLQQRSYDKAFLPGGWEVVLEHAIAGETSKECAVRGIKEEVGLCIHESDVLFTGRMIWEECNHIMDVYFVKADFNVDELTLERGKVIGAKFVSKEQILEHVSEICYRPEEYRQFITHEIMKLNRKTILYSGNKILYE